MSPAIARMARVAVYERSLRAFAVILCWSLAVGAAAWVPPPLCTFSCRNAQRTGPVPHGGMMCADEREPQVSAALKACMRLGGVKIQAKPKKQHAALIGQLVPTMWQEWDDFITHPRAAELKAGTLVGIICEDGLHRYGEVVQQCGVVWERKYQVLEDQDGSVGIYTPADLLLPTSVGMQKCVLGRNLALLSTKSDTARAPSLSGQVTIRGERRSRLARAAVREVRYMYSVVKEFASEYNSLFNSVLDITDELAPQAQYEGSKGGAIEQEKTESALAPQAKMEMPKAKIMALEVNRRQWGIGAEVIEPEMQSADADFGVTMPATRRIGSFSPVGTSKQSVQTRGKGGRRIGSITPMAAKGSEFGEVMRDEERGPSFAVPEARMQLTRAKLEAVEANRQQWGIDITAIADKATDAAGTGFVRRRIGSIVPAGMAARSVELRRSSARRIGSINPPNESPGRSGLESSDFVEIYNAGKPLGTSTIADAKRAAIQENLRRCARKPFLNPGLGSEWETWESDRS